jgi:hypothetical protein
MGLAIITPTRTRRRHTDMKIHIDQLCVRSSSTGKNRNKEGEKK